MAETLLEDEMVLEQRLVVGVGLERLTGPAVVADLAVVVVVDGKPPARQLQTSAVVVMVTMVAAQMGVERAVVKSPAEPQAVIVVLYLGRRW